MYAHHFADPPAQLVRDAVSLVDVDADTFTKDELHSGRVTQLDHDLHYEVDSFVVGSQPVQVDRVVNRRVPRYQRTDL